MQRAYCLASLGKVLIPSARRGKCSVKEGFRQAVYLWQGFISEVDIWVAC